MLLIFIHIFILLSLFDMFYASINNNKLNKVNTHRLTSLNRLNTPYQSLDSNKIDLIFSSGFLGFSRHCGFYSALSDIGIDANSNYIGNCIGTSSGSLIASLIASGNYNNPDDISYELSKQKPIKLISFSSPLHLLKSNNDNMFNLFSNNNNRSRRGLFSLRKLTKELEIMGIRKDFNDFKYPLAVGK